MKHVLFKIVAVVRSTNSSKILNNTITVILHCNYTVIILQLRLHYVNVVLTTTVAMHYVYRWCDKLVVTEVAT